MEEGYELDESGQSGDGQVLEEAGQGDQPVQEVAPQVVEGEVEETAQGPALSVGVLEYPGPCPHSLLQPLMACTSFTIDIFSPLRTVSQPKKCTTSINTSPP